MPPLPRAICPTCEREVAVRVGGELREHRDGPPALGGRLCPASGKTVVEVEKLIAGEVDAVRGLSRRST